MSDVTITVNPGAGREINRNLRRALTKIGLQAESYAKMLCPSDTGLLRNSITYAIGGEAPHITQYTDDDNSQTGEYTQVAPPDDSDQMTLYLGTNVHYAIYQELGHHTPSGGWVPPNEFLRPAIENHISEYEQIIQRECR